MRPGGFAEPRLKNSPQDCFCPPGRRRRAQAVRIHPLQHPVQFHTKQKEQCLKSTALGAAGGIRTSGLWSRRTTTGRYRQTPKREICCSCIGHTQNKKKPIVGCHNRLFRHFAAPLHSSGQMVVNHKLPCKEIIADIFLI